MRIKKLEQFMKCFEANFLWSSTKQIITNYPQFCQKIFLLCTQFAENIFLLQKKFEIESKPFRATPTIIILVVIQPTMNESCVPKCLNLWKTCQDIYLSPFSKKIYDLIMDRKCFCQHSRLTDLIFGEPSTYPSPYRK